jgi:competence protein ComEA
MKTWWVIALTAVVSLLAAGALLLVSRQPRGEAVRLVPPPSPQPLVVHVSGAVRNPGVYQLSPGSRVQDAIGAAGGLLPDADEGALNLAALLKDGQRVQVVTQTQAQETAVRSSAAELPVDINSAMQEDLESLPGIGPVLAQRIIAYREANGPFAAVEDLQQVEGVGADTFEKLKDLVTVEGSP